MKSYDDLQRFKEKTQINHIEFKDMSEQIISSDNTNWAVIKQLLNEGAGSVLDNSQRIDQATPQRVDPAVFSASSTASPTDVAPLTGQAYAAAAPAATSKVGTALLDSISASLHPADAATEAAVLPPAAALPATDTLPLRSLPVARKTAVAGSSLLDQLAATTPAATPVSSAPQAQAIQPVVQPAAAAPVNPSFKQLFSPAGAAAPSALSKDMLLKPLLEKIASCR